MLYALLICSDEDCDVEVEAYGELEELDVQVCDSCGCVLQAVAYSSAGPQRPPERRGELELREAA
jgi:hypothetical protein